MIAGNPVFIVSVVHIWYAFEACRQSLSDLFLTDIPLASRLRSARHQKLAIVRKEVHYGIEVVRVECRDKLLEGLNRYRLLGATSLVSPINAETVRAASNLSKLIFICSSPAAQKSNTGKSQYIQMKVNLPPTT